MAPGRSTDPSRSLGTPLRRARFILAIVVATALVLSAPFIGFVRSWIRATFPGQFVRIVGGAIAVLAAAAIVAAILRIRQNRLLRYGALLAAVAGAIWFSIVEATGNADVDVVQRFHFVEYGIITFLFYRAWRALEDPAILLLPALAGLLVGTADEWLQWFIPNRVGEIADILLNGIAIGCGLLFSVGADPPARFTWSMRPGSILRVGRLAAATVVALALFVHIVHLGDDINDREVGVFKSRYSMTALPALAAAKRAEWQMHPPPLTLQRVSREDQYMTEGVTHVQRRNELLGADQAKGAWMENLILEKYYAPVLDTPSYVSRTGHRWSAEQRASVDVRAAGSDPSYVSAANPYPIFAWSRSVFWVASGIAAAAVWIAARLAERSIHPRSEASTAV
ncbi:MAG TPA: VanZ family protein [Vicinamibacterales bacterium]|jgi:VanZ like protein|nr:VanZ family protein [Vicinamibacterales bacterium]